MRRFRQWTALLMFGVMLMLQGCSGREKAPAEQNEETKTMAAKEPDADEKAMGRYLEEEITLPEDVTLSSYPKMAFQKLDTGELLLVEQTAGIYVSEDNGRSWTPRDASWIRELREAYILHLSIAPDGAAAVVYSMPSKDEDAEDSFQPECIYVDPQGNVKLVACPAGESYIHQFWFDRDSRLYGYGMSKKVYEIDPENGSSKQLFETEGLTDFVCFTKQYMIDITSVGILFYDIEREMLVDGDRVLQEFIMENVGDEIGNNTDSYSVVMAAENQEDAVCFACSSGLYRHVVGGTAVEQIIGGDLSSLGNPMMKLAGMAVLPDNEFAVLYTDGKMYRYIYDPDIPAVPEEQVSIYSLTENYAIRQAASLFQKQHPEVYIRYEVGYEEGSGMTSEDAVKNLNTKIMSGSGPDLLVLDGLPRVSYEEKGVLADLSKIVETLRGEDALFSNLVEACREDGKLYYMPIRFRLPLLVGDPEVIEKATDLTKLADVVEELREENPEGPLTGLTTEDKVLRTLGINCSGEWTDMRTGAIDQEKLTEFLQQARRIYQAEIAGIEKDELTAQRESYERIMEWSWAKEYFASASSAAMSVALGERKLGIGTVYMVDGDFNTVSTLSGQGESCGYTVWQGQIQNGFIPKGMTGICTGSEEKEYVLAFFRFLYGRELQDIEMSTGLPVNQASFDHLKENQRAEDEGISIGTSNGDGEYFSLDIKWVGEEDFEELKRMVESASTVCTGDETIEETVYEIGQKALNGSASVEDVVAEIIKKAAIYLAE